MCRKNVREAGDGRVTDRPLLLYGQFVSRRTGTSPFLLINVVAKHIQWKLLVLVEGFTNHFWLVNQMLLLGDVFLELLLRFLVVFVCCTVRRIQTAIMCS
jgi:hypothetical protein